MAQQIALQVDFARSALATRAQRWPLLAWPIWTRSSDWRVKAISIEYTEWVWKCMESSHCSDMISINQPITQKSKSHYRVFLGEGETRFHDLNRIQRPQNLSQESPDMVEGDWRESDQAHFGGLVIQWGIFGSTQNDNIKELLWRQLLFYISCFPNKVW